MIRFIKGSLAMTGENEVVLENHGIGYRIFVPFSVMEALPEKGQEVLLYTYLSVREDAMQLFGFLTQEALDVFLLLITVSGIGPKAALGILGALSPSEIQYAVLAGDEKMIAKAPGIGKKTAGKLILELKDKFDAETFLGEDETQQESASADALKETVRDAVEALTALGYARADALRAVRSVGQSADLTVEELLRESLKAM